MAFLGALVPLIQAAFPFLAAGTAAALGTTAVLVGMGGSLQDAFDTLNNTLFQARSRAWIAVRDDFRQLLASPLAQQALSSQGVDPGLIGSSLETAANNGALTSFLLNPFPTMATLQEVDQYYNLTSELFTTGLMAESVYLSAHSWYQAERSRLLAVAAAPTTAPTLTEVLPLTTFALPGGTTVGVRVRAGFVGGEAVAPTPTVPTTVTPSIVNNFSPQITAEIDTRPIGDAVGMSIGRLEEANTRAIGDMGRTVAGALPAIGSQVALGLGALAPALGLAIAGVGPAFAQGLLSQAQGLGHGMQQGRYGCQGSFLGSLLGVFGAIGPQLATGVILATDNPIRQALDRLVAEVIDKMGLGSRFVQPVDYDTAVGNAAARLNQAVSFGLAAQAIAFTAEALTPLKQMGFGQIAGFMGELAGFKRLADGLMGTLENAAIYRPLMYEANRRFRPNIPDDRQLTLMYQKRSLTRGELSEWQEKLGLPDLYIDRLPGFIFNDPNPALIIRAFQIAEPGAVTFSEDDRRIAEIAGIDLSGPDAYFRLKLAKSGLDNTDVEAFIPVIKMGILRREQTIRYSQIERLYRDGFIGTERAREEINKAREPAPVVDYRMAALELSREYALLRDTRSATLMAMSRGLVTRDEAREQLGKLGMPGDRVELEVLKATLGMIPGVRLEVRAPEELLEGAEVE